METYCKGSIKKMQKILHDSTKHYPNKDEAAVLRKLMSFTGLSEIEIRAIKKYRIILSKAQKDGQNAKNGKVTKWYCSLIKRACRQTKLVPQHPETLKVLQKLIDNGDYPRGLYFFHNNLSAKTVVKYYAK